MATFAAAPGRGRRVAETVRMLGNETAKGLRIMWSRKAALVPQLVGMPLMYLLTQLLVGDGHIVRGLLPRTLFAYVSYVIGYMTVLRTVAGLLEEVNAGTLEQTQLTPLRPWALPIGRIGASLAEGMITGLVIAAGLAVALGVHVPARPAALVPVAILLADIAGFALLVGGLALVVNAIGAIVHVFQMLIVVVNGSLIPLAAFPPGLATFGEFIPTTLGGEASRRVLFGHESLAGVWADHSLPLALLHAAAMLLAGWAVYQAAVRKGLREGRLGP